MNSNRREFFRQAGIMGLSLGSLKERVNHDSEKETPVLSSRRPENTNSQIEKARHLALDILKPTARQLEHGLELHRDSIVIDSYGFMPRAASDGSKLATAIQGGASLEEIQDMQENMTMTRFTNHELEKVEFENAWRTSGVTCVIQNAGEESNQVGILLKRLARFTYATDMMPGFLQRVAVPQDIETVKKKGKHALYFSGNGVPLPYDLISKEQEMRYIELFFQLGIRMMHLTYNRRNLIGDGCGEATDAGLSDFGRAVVKEMNRVGVIIDTAHCGQKTSLEAARSSEQPVVASHSAASSLNTHIRAKTDEVIKAIADKQGYIGICCIPRFLGGNGNILAMLEHIGYVVRKFGADYASIGTDVPYTSQFAAEENKKIPAYRRGRTRWEALWPADAFRETPTMRQSMAWTNWPLFTVGLVQRGYSDDVIRKIIGGNALRVAKEVYKASLK